MKAHSIKKKPAKSLGLQAGETNAPGLEIGCDVTSCSCASIHNFERIDTATFTDEDWQFAEETFDGFVEMQEGSSEPRFSTGKLRYLANWLAANRRSVDAANSMRDRQNQLASMQFMLDRTGDTFAPVNYFRCDLEAYTAAYFERFTLCISRIAAEIAAQEGRLE
jgi:hypothetical protein